MLLELDNFSAAAHGLEPYLVRTPLLYNPTMQCWLKAENLQRSGSFKLRGALNRLLSLTPEQRAKGVVCFSSGNHAQAVALAGQLLRTAVTVYMPQDSMPHKVEATRRYGATVIQEGVTPATRSSLAVEFSQRTGATLVPPFDDAHVITGQGTTGLEIVEQFPGVEAVVVPLGGGGLLSGIATAIHTVKPQVRIYGVEPALGNDGQQSLRKGRRITIDPPDTIADGARTMALGVLTFAAIQQHVTDILTVTDQELLETMRFLALDAKLVVEPTGALAAAAWRGGSIPGRNTVVVLSGGNVAPAILSKALATA